MACRFREWHQWHATLGNGIKWSGHSRNALKIPAERKYPTGSVEYGYRWNRLFEAVPLVYSVRPGGRQPMAMTVLGNGIRWHGHWCLGLIN
jgi:hypothetical protein